MKKILIFNCKNHILDKKKTDLTITDYRWQSVIKLGILSWQSYSKPDRLVLSADKGNCVVVMDKQQYHDKALTLLNDKSTFAVLNSDPTSKNLKES